MDDKMTFFQQLSTLISSGTPLLQAMQICRRAEPEPQAAARAGGDRRPRGGRQLAARRRGQLSAHLPAPLDRGHPHRRNHRPDGLVLLELNKQIRESRETAPQGQRRPDVSHHPDLRRRDCRHRHAVAGGAHLRQDVQGHGRRTARHHPVRRRCLRTSSSITGSTSSAASSRSCWHSAVPEDRSGPAPRASASAWPAAWSAT